MRKRTVARIKAFAPGPLKRACTWLLRLPRLYSSRDRMLPGYIIFGSMRCGTSSLYHALTDHPNVLPALRKQANFFDANYPRGCAWYRSHFPRWREARQVEARVGGPVITGEASPEYIFCPEAPERIARDLPRVRLIALVRHPVDRAWSHYHHSRRLGDEELSFEEAIAAEEGRLSAAAAQGPERAAREMHLHGYLAQGRYADSLAAWYARFGAERIMVVRAEDMFADPAGTIEAIGDFLGLPHWRPESYEALNEGRYDQMSPRMRAELLERFREPNRRLAQLIGRDLGWDE